MERRRMRRKPGFAKRMMVTILSLTMLMSLFTPGMIAGAEEVPVVQEEEKSFLDNYMAAYEAQTLGGGELSSLATTYIARINGLKSRLAALDAASETYAADLHALLNEIAAISASISSDKESGLFTDADWTAVFAAVQSIAGAQNGAAGVTTDSSLTSKTVTAYVDGKTFAVTGKLPQGVSLSVEELDEALTAYVRGDVLGLGALPAGFTSDAYDIKLMVDGAEYQPTEAVTLGITADGITTKADVDVYHLPNTTAAGVGAVSAADLENSALFGNKIENVNVNDGYYAFYTDGFSVYYMTAGNLYASVEEEEKEVELNEVAAGYVAQYAALTERAKLLDPTAESYDTDWESLAYEAEQVDNAAVASYEAGEFDEAQWNAVSQASADFYSVLFGEDTSNDVSESDTFPRPGEGGNSTSGTFDHIEIEVSASASLVVNGKTLTENFTLTVNDLKNGNTTVITKAPDGTTTSKVWSDSSIVKGDGSNSDETIELTGVYDTGTIDAPYYYTIQIQHSVTFVDEDTNESYTVPITLSVTTHYWDSINNCPGLGSNWSNGYFSRGSGIDVPIGGMGNYTSEGNIQLTKVLSGVEANEDVSFTLAIYQKQADGSYALYDTKPVTIDASANATTAAILLMKVPVGDYVIVEVDPQQVVNGMDFESVAYSSDVKKIEVTVNNENVEVTGGTVTVLDKQQSALTITNTYAASTGDLILEKKISGYTPVEDEVFTFTITAAEGVDLSEWTAPEGVTVNGNIITATVTVAAGETSGSLMLMELPIGTYAVSETLADGSMYASSGTVEVTVAAQEEVVATITNTAKKSDVTVSKTVTGNMGDYKKEFSFTASITGGSMNGIEYVHSNGTSGTISGDSFTFNLKHGENITFNDIVYGAELVVVEAESAYTVYVNDVLVNDRTGKVTAAGVDATIAFTNYNQADVDTGIEMDSYPFILMLSMISVMAVFFIIGKRRMMF